MKSPSVRLRLAATLAATLAAAPAAAQEGELFKNILSGAGILPTPNNDIEYRERAPLVVPPKLELRQPEAKRTAERGAAESAPERGAAWPNDPDVQRRRRDAAEARRPAPGGDINGNRVAAENPSPGRRLPDSDAPHLTRGDSPRDEVMSPDRLRAFSVPTKAEDAPKAGQDVARRSLTDPPGGYRRATEIVRTSPEPVRDTEREDMDPTAYTRRDRGR